jgi:hypothetical protein
MQANAAKESLVRLIRHTCQCLLRTLADADPAGHDRVPNALHSAASAISRLSISSTNE